MAINVDWVYKTVLLILNKEQRGYITPEEFSKISTQVQLEMLESYFEDLNQQLRVPQGDSEYADRQKSLDDRISPFKTTSECVYAAGRFVLPSNLYRIGTVIYNDETEVDRVQKNDILYINKSKLTRPTTTYPLYAYEREGGETTTSGTPYIYVYPKTITTGISASYIRKPTDVKWAFTTGALGQYIYDAPSSRDFELDASEQASVVLKVLMYMGIIIQDYQFVQTTAQQVQAEMINSKS